MARKRNLCIAAVLLVHLLFSSSSASAKLSLPTVDKLAVSCGGKKGFARAEFVNSGDGKPSIQLTSEGKTFAGAIIHQIPLTLRYHEISFVFDGKLSQQGMFSQLFMNIAYRIPSSSKGAGVAKLTLGYCRNTETADGKTKVQIRPIASDGKTVNIPDGAALEWIEFLVWT